MFITAELIHALPSSDRRCLDRKEAASYFCVSPPTFDKLVRNGDVPPPIQLLGRKVWDKHALDHALDVRSGISEFEHCENNLDRELSEFRAKHGHG